MVAEIYSIDSNKRLVFQIIQYLLYEFYFILFCYFAAIDDQISENHQSILTTNISRRHSVSDQNYIYVTGSGSQQSSEPYNSQIKFLYNLDKENELCISSGDTRSENRTNQTCNETSIIQNAENKENEFKIIKTFDYSQIKTSKKVIEQNEIANQTIGTKRLLFNKDMVPSNVSQNNSKLSEDINSEISENNFIRENVTTTDVSDVPLKNFEKIKKNLSSINAKLKDSRKTVCGVWSQSNSLLKFKPKKRTNKSMSFNQKKPYWGKESSNGCVSFSYRNYAKTKLGYLSKTVQINIDDDSVSSQIDQYDYQNPYKKPQQARKRSLSKKLTKKETKKKSDTIKPIKKNVKRTDTIKKKSKEKDKVPTINIPEFKPDNKNLINIIQDRNKKNEYNEINNVNETKQRLLRSRQPEIDCEANDKLDNQKYPVDAVATIYQNPNQPPFSDSVDSWQDDIPDIPDSIREISNSRQNISFPKPIFSKLPTESEPEFPKISDISILSFKTPTLTNLMEPVRTSKSVVVNRAEEPLIFMNLSPFKEHTPKRKQTIQESVQKLSKHETTKNTKYPTTQNSLELKKLKLYHKWGDKVDKSFYDNNFLLKKFIDTLTTPTVSEINYCAEISKEMSSLEVNCEESSGQTNAENEFMNKTSDQTFDIDKISYDNYQTLLPIDDCTKLQKNTSVSCAQNHGNTLTLDKNLTYNVNTDFCDNKQKSFNENPKIIGKYY